MEENKITFAFFPYLKTSGAIKYRDITIRSSEDISDIPANNVQHIENLRNLFFLRDHVKIKKTSYAFYAPNDQLTISNFIQQIKEFQTLVCFFYSSPHPTSGEPFLRHEHSSLFLFQPTQVSKFLLINEHNSEILPEAQTLEFDSRHEISGYEGRLNNISYFWVTKSSRIYPPSVNMWLNISQHLDRDLDHSIPKSQRYGPVYSYFINRKETDTNFDDRILTALTWYNKSIGIDIDESVALVNLAIAFESLLGLEKGDRITNRFKEAITLLVGEVPRIESWINQFYNTRSQIIHEGKSSNLSFIATDDIKKDSKKIELEYRSLLSYGRQVFQVCIATILTGAKIAEQINSGLKKFAKH